MKPIKLEYTVNIFIVVMVLRMSLESVGNKNPRYRGLDALRGIAMLLGILLHASIPYISKLLNIEWMWPADDDQSVPLLLMMDFIHVWRMPLFFLLAGFFAHLLLERRGLRTLIINRVTHIGFPLLIFGTATALLVPFLWAYGWTGSYDLESFQNIGDKVLDLKSSGGLIAHLWFLYYLLLLYSVIVVVKSLWSAKSSLILIFVFWCTFFCAVVYAYGIGPLEGVGIFKAFSLLVVSGLAAVIATIAGFATGLIRVVLRPTLVHYMSAITYSRIPIALALGATVLLILRAGDEAKPIWPVNIPDLMYAALFFFYGFGLWEKQDLITLITRSGSLVLLWFFSAIAYFGHLILSGISDSLKAAGNTGQFELFSLLNNLFYGFSAALLSIALLGTFEAIMTGSNSRWQRWLADSSYWIYIMHLPVVAFFTFWLAHADRSGFLLTHTGLNWTAESKFLVSCSLTITLGLLSYRYFVRYTPIGTLLNGKREKHNDS
jgi:peptidoglycan/LPS O-acetylase OafA/YrhL